MAVLRPNDIKKFTKEQAVLKLDELDRVMLELEGEGKREKKKAVRKAIARLKTYIHMLNSKEKTVKPKAG